MGSLMQYDMFGGRRVWQGCGRVQGPHCEYIHVFLALYLFVTDVWLTVLLFSTCRVIGVPSATSYMLTYDHLLNNVLPPLIPYPAAVPLTAGMLARATITSLMSPLELIRTNLQSTPPSPSNPHTLRSVLTSIRTLARTEGLHYLWRGLGPTLWRDVPFSGVYWAGYESCKRAFAGAGMGGPQVAFVSGALSGITAALLTSPFDVLKTRRQALLVASAAAPAGSTRTFTVLMHVLRTEGVSALYTGIMPRIAKIAPACGIMIACYEVRQSWLVHRSNAD